MHISCMQQSKSNGRMHNSHMFRCNYHNNKSIVQHKCVCIIYRTSPGDYDTLSTYDTIFIYGTHIIHEEI